MLFFGKPGMSKFMIASLLLAAAIIITLAVAGFWSLTSEPVKLADEFFKNETGFDLEEAEEELFNK